MATAGKKAGAKAASKTGTKAKARPGSTRVKTSSAATGPALAEAGMKARAKDLGKDKEAAGPGRGSARPGPAGPAGPGGNGADKQRKPKLVRDSFTIPKAEYGVLEELKQRAARLGRPAKKSEVLRAGVKALAAMTDADFMASVGAVPAIKTGRPAKA